MTSKIYLRSVLLLSLSFVTRRIGLFDRGTSNCGDWMKPCLNSLRPSFFQASDDSVPFSLKESRIRPKWSTVISKACLTFKSPGKFWTKLRLQVEGFGKSWELPAVSSGLTSLSHS